MACSAPGVSITHVFTHGLFDFDFDFDPERDHDEETRARAIAEHAWRTSPCGRRARDCPTNGVSGVHLC